MRHGRQHAVAGDCAQLASHRRRLPDTILGLALGGLYQPAGRRAVAVLRLQVSAALVPHASRHQDPSLGWPGALLITEMLGNLQLFIKMLPKKRPVATRSRASDHAVGGLHHVQQYFQRPHHHQTEESEHHAVYGILVGGTIVLGVVLSNRWTSHRVIAAFILVGGLGLGFILPNMTIFIEKEASREHPGTPTALMQSLLMISTAIISTLLNNMYATSLRQALNEKKVNSWFRSFCDPQILVSQETQTTVLAQLALIGAIHMGLRLAVIVIALWLARRVPAITLHSKL